MTVERAAKAMKAWDDQTDPDWVQTVPLELYKSQARVTLEAIAEPTDEMIKAGAYELRDIGRVSYEAHAVEVWHAMHAAMMKETK